MGYGPWPCFRMKLDFDCVLPIAVHKRIIAIIIRCVVLIVIGIVVALYRPYGVLMECGAHLWRRRYRLSGLLPIAAMLAPCNVAHGTGAARAMPIRL